MRNTTKKSSPSLLLRRQVDIEQLLQKRGHSTVLTEDSAASTFVELYGADVRYDHTAKQWYIWNGSVWVPDYTRAVYASLRDLARDLSKGMDDSAQKNFGRAAFVRGVEAHAKCDRDLVVTSDRWDQDRNLLGTPSGVVDLTTGRLNPAGRSDFITKLTAAGPGERAECPRWLEFLRQITGGDRQLVRLLQLWAGYLLTGDTKEEVLIFLYGPGGNGKTVLINTLSRLLGDYATVASMQALMASKYDRHPEEIACLADARLVVASETDAGRRWDEARIKLLTGGNEIRTRGMRQNSWTFRPEFKLMIEGNHLPSLSNVTEAIRRRFLIVPFAFKPKTPDRDLEQKLEREWPGILRWAIEGTLQWRQHGLPRPKALAEATSAYLGGQDVVGNWLKEHCIVRSSDRRICEASSSLYKCWSSYAQRRGEEAGSQRAFNELLRGAGLSGPQQIRAINTKGFYGIKLKGSDRSEA